MNFDLQDEFALHQPLSLWAIDAISHLDRTVEVPPRRPHRQAPAARPARSEPRAATDGGAFAGLHELLGLDAALDDESSTTTLSSRGPTTSNRRSRMSFAPTVTVSVGATGDIDRALAIVTIIEAVQENPAVVIAAQLRKAKDALMSEMKSARVEYEERMERLAKVEPPRPMKDWIYGDFNSFRTRHPWVGGDTVKPKSVARDLFERSMTFGEYIDFYGLKQSEGAVLRYLSDVYKGLLQNVPVDAGSDELDEIVHWLGTLVRSVDSSLLDEWERLQNPDPVDLTAAPATPIETDITTDARAFRTMVRNMAFSWVEQVARRRRPAAADDRLDLDTELAPYWAEYDAIDTGGDARHTSRFAYDATTGAIHQTLHDPEGHDEWRLIGQVDLVTSRAEGRLVATLLGSNAADGRPGVIPRRWSVPLQGSPIKGPSRAHRCRPDRDPGHRRPRGGSHRRRRDAGRSSGGACCAGRQACRAGEAEQVGSHLHRRRARRPQGARHEGQGRAGPFSRHEG